MLETIKGFGAKSESGGRRGRAALPCLERHSTLHIGHRPLQPCYSPPEIEYVTLFLALPQVSVQITCSKETMGVFSTYLVVQSATNPADISTVRVKIEVVADGNIMPGDGAGRPFFYILAESAHRNHRP